MRRYTQLNSKMLTTVAIDCAARHVGDFSGAIDLGQPAAWPDNKQRDRAVKYRRESRVWASPGNSARQYDHATGRCQAALVASWSFGRRLCHPGSRNYG